MNQTDDLVHHDDDDDDDDDESDDGDDVVNEATELDLGTNPRVSQSHFRTKERQSAHLWINPRKVERISSKISHYKTSRLLIWMLSASYYVILYTYSDTIFAILASLRICISNSLIYSSSVVSFQ